MNRWNCDCLACGKSRDVWSQAQRKVASRSFLLRLVIGVLLAWVLIILLSDGHRP